MNMTSLFSRASRGLVALVASAAVLTGCSVSLEDVPMPSVVKGPTYELSAVFTSALGLPDQADVKMDGAIVGEVQSVKADGYSALVSMKVKKSIQLTSNSRAELQFTSPMGEAFVALIPGPAGGTPLAAGSTIGLKKTNAAPSATDLLATLSTVVSGGTFADLSIIVKQLNVALKGNTGNARAILEGLDGTLKRLNAHTGTFETALDNLSRLSEGLASDRALLSTAISGFEPTVRVLRAQTGRALELMTELRRLSASGQTLIASGRAHMLAVTRDLGPILDTLTRNAAVFPQIFDGIGAFGRASDSTGYGLYSNFDLTTIFQGNLVGGIE